MSQFIPLEFQKKAIQELLDAFMSLWSKNEPQRHIVFKSPTGSGKTFMVSCFINELNTLPNWDYDKAIIWITFSDTLAMQSKVKFNDYFNKNLKNNLLTVEDFNQGKLNKNDILFINWQKLVSTSAESRILRRPEDVIFHKEQGYYFEDIIENTRRDNREIFMVVDESHTHLSDLAQRSVVDVVNPRVIINVSATPKYIPNKEEEEEGIAAFVNVKREDVIEEGLIKEKIVVQTDEDLRKNPGKDLDELLLDLAIERKNNLVSEYRCISKTINPLILIQLPNDDNKLKESGQKTKEQFVLEYLTKKGYDIDACVALWFDGKQKNMNFIDYQESDIDFMLFKQAAGTGWDCPRAHILVMFREISSAVFYHQTIGRILRSPEPTRKEDYKNSPSLRTGYLFTNYRRNEIRIPDQSSKNKPFVFCSTRKDWITNIKNLYSDFVARSDYGDLGNSYQFQMSFLRSMDNFFGITENEFMDGTRIKISKKGVNLNPNLTIKVIVDAEFTNYDKLSLDLLQMGKDEDYPMSSNDVEKLFNYLCYSILLEQTEAKTKISNISRSWSPLKSALRVWFKRSLDLNSDYYYRVFITDVLKEHASVFKLAINQALKEYYPARKIFFEKRKKDIEHRENTLFEINEHYYFTDDFEEIVSEICSCTHCAVEPFYLRKKYLGRENELKFIKYLEQKKEALEWWFKNGEGNKEDYCLKYRKNSTGEEALFYPDWIVKLKNGHIGLFDTKDGFSAQNPDGRAEGIYEKIKELNKVNNIHIGGLVASFNNLWYVSTDLPYEYNPKELTKNWHLLDKILSYGV